MCKYKWEKTDAARNKLNGGMRNCWSTLLILFYTWVNYKLNKYKWKRSVYEGVGICVAPLQAENLQFWGKKA